MDKIYPITAAGLASFKEEKIQLLEKRKSAVVNLRTAREMGDLSENAAYKVARQELSGIDSRLRYLEKIIRLSRIVESNSKDQIGIGNRVKLNGETGDMEYTIVGGFESDPARAKISHISPIGKALIGKKQGDEIKVNTPLGVKSYRVSAILE